MAENSKPAVTSMDEFLVDVIVKVLQSQPANPLNSFGRISDFILEKSYTPNKKTNDLLPCLPYTKYEGAALAPHLGWADSYVKATKPPEKKKQEGTEENAETTDAAAADADASERFVADIAGEAQLFEEAGIGLAKEEVFRLAVSIDKLSKDKKLTTARFFGKIFGTNANYYICESDMKREEQGDQQPPAEEENAADKTKPKAAAKIPVEKNVGANRYIYWVTTSAFGQWEQLPDLSPEVLLASRKIRKYFTGNLQAPVHSHPPFPGVEKDYLRAQIARIVASTYINPKGWLKLEKEETNDSEEQDSKPKPTTVDAYTEIPAIIKADDFKLENFDMENLSHWVHFTPAILQSQGRCTLYRTKEEEEALAAPDDDPEKPKKKIDVEQILPILSPVTLEASLHVNRNTDAMLGWTVQKCQKMLNAKFVILRNMRWPGAYTACKLGTRNSLKFANIYFGYGAKYALNGYTPTFPLEVAADFATQHEITEQMDPTPEMVQSDKYREPPPPPEEKKEDPVKNEDDNVQPQDE